MMMVTIMHIMTSFGLSQGVAQMQKKNRWHLIELKGISLESGGE